MADKGASSWLNALPLENQDFSLNKKEFRDALRLRYDIPLENLPSTCARGEPFYVKDTVALQMLYFLKIKIFISLDSCQFVEYLFRIKIHIFQFLKTKKGDNVSFMRKEFIFPLIFNM